jgi:hypothetical protein
VGEATATAGSEGCWLTAEAAPNTKPPVCPSVPPPPNGFHVPAEACGAREREEAGAWRRLAKRGARREDGGAPAEGSGPGGARPSPRPGFAMEAAVAAAGSSEPLGFWRGEAGPTAGGIPRVGGAAAGGGGGGGLWKAGNGRMGRGACDRLIRGDPRLLLHGHSAAWLVGRFRNS